MRFLVDDVDYTDFVDRGSVEIDHQLDDTIPSAKLTIQDDGSQFFFQAWNRLTIIDETAYSNPTHNILINPTFSSSGNKWTATIPVGSISYSGNQATMSVNTATSFTSITLNQTTRTNFVQPNQLYTFSCNYTISSLSNAQCVIQYTTYGFDGTPVATTTQTYAANTSGTQQFIANISTAPNIRYITVDFELQNSSSSSALDSDTFVRGNVVGGWGTATGGLGSTWTFSGASATKALTSNEGILSATGGSDTNAQLGSTTSTNQEVLCRIAVNNSGDIAAVNARFNSSGPTTYKLIWYGGAIHLNKQVSGTVTVLANKSFTMTPGTFYWLKLRTQGTAISGKIWKTGTTEPSSWTLTATDSSISSAGGFGVLGNSSSGTGVQFDSFTATSISSTTVVGTFVVSNPQLELNTFPTVSYPTPPCVAGATNCTSLGDGTVVRQKRLFGGLISHLQRDYPDSSSNRFWDLDASGAGILLSKVFCSANYTNATDQFVIQDLIATYLPNDLTTTNVVGTSGIIFDQISWQDVPLKDAFSSIAKSSNYLLWVDPYFDMHYQNEGYTQASYDLSDNPDMVTSFPYYNYQIVDDAAEMSMRIKVYGGSTPQTTQPALVESFSGTGSQKVFNLANIPISVNNISVGGTTKKVGISGKDSSASYDVLVNKPSQTITFTAAPASGTNNITVTYTYKNPSAIRAVDANSIATYGFTFDGKIEDTSLVTQADIYSRGITALQEYSTPRTTITLYTDYYFSIGDTVALSSDTDNYSSTAFTIQKVKAIILGTDQTNTLICQYQLELGAYRPSFIHHLLHIHKQVKHTSSHVATVAEEHVFNIERLNYAEAVSTTSAASGLVEVARAFGGTLVYTPGGGGGGGGTGVTTYASDTFTRANTTASTLASVAWSPASDGEGWTVPMGGGTYQIVSNRGTITKIPGLSVVRLGTTSQQNAVGLVRVLVTSSAFTNAGISLRQTGGNTMYRFRLNSNDSSQGFGIVKTVSGTSTNIATTSFSVTPGSAYWIKAYVSGSTLQGKIWLDGTSEPAGWTITTSNTSISAAGGFGLTATCNNTTDTVKFDSFTVTAP